jgi:hypothetical protein
MLDGHMRPFHGMLPGSMAPSDKLCLSVGLDGGERHVLANTAVGGNTRSIGVLDGGER